MINKVILIGHLGADPEQRFTQAGVAMSTFSIATSERWKDKDGQQQQQTEWHRIVAWRQRAEFCNKYLHKGSKIYLEGKLQTRKWQDQNGSDRWITEIVASNIEFLTPKGEGGNYGGPGGSYDPGPEPPPSSGSGYDNFPGGQSGGSGGGSTGSDVPF